MREKYESLSAATLKELAKARGIKAVSAMKKSEVIEAMLAEDAKEASGKTVKEVQEKGTQERPMQERGAQERPIQERGAQERPAQ